jgi:hypothetical protein
LFAITSIRSDRPAENGVKITIRVSDIPGNLKKQVFKPLIRFYLHLHQKGRTKEERRKSERRAKGIIKKGCEKDF